MKDQDQRIALAKWEGIPVDICKCGDSEESHTLGRQDHPFIPMADKSDVPDYLNDLNAVHRLEEKLRGRAFWWLAFSTELYKSAAGIALALGVHRPESLWLVSHATARQRCEALLRTLGLWKEDK